MFVMQNPQDDIRIQKHFPAFLIAPAAFGMEPPNMMRVFTQLLKLPIEAFVYSVDMLVKTLQGLQRLTEKGIDSVLAERANAGTEDASIGNSGDDLKDSAVDLSVGATKKENKNMSDQNGNNLGGKNLKLVRYKILFVKRGFEVAFPEQEDLIADDLTPEAFTAWKVAQFIQSLPNIKRPQLWADKNYPHYTSDHPKPADGHIHWLNEDDKKFLRVYYQVLAIYPREEGKEQVEVLQEIRDVLDNRLKPIGG
jgi:hypothetical protein